MPSLKRLLHNPYVYTLLLGYYGVWLVWNFIKIPFRNHAGIISALPQMHYNPANNLLRFLLAIFVPPFLCLVLWVLLNTDVKTRVQRLRASRYLLPGILVTGCVLLCLSMGLVANSTSPANNPEVYGGPYDHALIDTFHEGETLGPAISYQQPNLKPYRDFVVVHGVFQDPLRTVIAFKLFGQSIGASRAFAAVLGTVAFLLLFVLMLVLFRRNVLKAAIGLGVFAALVMPVAVLPFIGAHIFGVQFPFRDIATIFFLIAATLGLRAAIDKRFKKVRLASLIIGFIVTAGFANSIDRALFISVLSMVWLALLYIMNGPKGFGKTTLLPYVLGLVLGVPILGLALKWAFGDFLSYLFTMSRYKEYLDGVVFAQPDMAVSLVLLSVSALIVWGGAKLLPGLRASSITKPASLGGKLHALRLFLKPFIQKHAVPILLFATALVFLRSAIGRADPGHFEYSVQWLYLFLVYAGVNWLFNTFKKKQVYVGFFAIVPLTFILALYVGQVKKTDIHNDTFPIHVQDEKFMRIDYVETANYLKKHLKPGETFATLTSEGAWYYFVNKPSPLKYPIIWYAFTAAQRQIIAQQLETKTNIKYIITNNNWTSAFDFVPNETRFPEVYAVLKQHYVPYLGLGQQTIWIRTNQ